MEASPPHPSPPPHPTPSHTQVTAIFNSSLEVAVTVFGETPSEGVIFHCADACVTVVVVDAAGGPSSIPFVLDPQTPNQKLRYQVCGCVRCAWLLLKMCQDLLTEAPLPQSLTNLCF